MHDPPSGFRDVRTSGQEQVLFTHHTFPNIRPFLEVDPSWADSVMNGLSLEDRIAQMMMVQAYSNMSEAHEKSVSKMISKYHVGGVAFFQGDPISQARLTNTLPGAIPRLLC